MRLADSRAARPGAARRGRSPRAASARRGARRRMGGFLRANSVEGGAFLMMPGTGRGQPARLTEPSGAPRLSRQVTSGRARCFDPSPSASFSPAARGRRRAGTVRSPRRPPLRSAWRPPLRPARPVPRRPAPRAAGCRRGGEAAEGAKLCSVFAPNNWRDSINVPSSWTARDCQVFAHDVGATEMQLGCIFDTGEPKVSIGPPGQLPERDCGWAEAPQEQVPRRR